MPCLGAGRLLSARDLMIPEERLIHTMRNKRIITVLAAVLILAVGIGVGAYAASSYGTQSDPLVAKSYLDSTLTPKLQAQFNAQVDSQVGLMQSQINSATTGLNFVVVNLSSGQVLKGATGCEIILRSGSAVSSGTGLSDVTDGSLITSGTAVSTNHLCVVSTSGDGLKASSAVTLLVRGGYTVS